MIAPIASRRKIIQQLPSTWSDIDFSKLSQEEIIYWFEERRIKDWLIKDTKSIKNKADSLLGFAAMVFIGVETLSQFRYGTTNNSEKYFSSFLEEYIHQDFKIEIKSPLIKDGGDKTTYSKIFYFGMRNWLIHSFLFRYAVLIEPLDKFLVWETDKNRLLVDARRLLTNFEDGVNKYFKELWSSEKGSEIYDNFFKVFALNYNDSKQNPNFKIEKWRSDLITLMNDITTLYHNNLEFIRLTEKWNKNKLDVILWNFAKRNYVSFMSMSIRRLCDNHKDSLSLWKIITDIKHNASAIKRDWFLTEWSGGSEESTFKEFFGESSAVQEKVVSEHIKNFEKVTQTIRDRADKFEAHKDKTPKLKGEPTFQDINKSVEIICSLYKKYYYLLMQRSLSFNSGSNI